MIIKTWHISYLWQFNENQLVKERTFTQKCNISLNGILSVLRYDKKFSLQFQTPKRKKQRFIGFMVHHPFGNISTVTRIFIFCRHRIFHYRKSHDISYFVLYHFSLKSILIEKYYKVNNQKMLILMLFDVIDSIRLQL